MTHFHVDNARITANRHQGDPSWPLQQVGPYPKPFRPFLSRKFQRLHPHLDHTCLVLALDQFTQGNSSIVSFLALDAHINLTFSFPQVQQLPHASNVPHLPVVIPLG